MRIVVCLCALLLLQACVTQRANAIKIPSGYNSATDSDSKPVNAEYKSAQESYTPEALSYAAYAFDTKIMMDLAKEKQEAGSLYRMAKGNIEQTPSYQVLLEYRYNIYLSIYQYYLNARRCGFNDPDSLEFIRLVPVLRGQMHQLRAHHIIDPVEKNLGQKVIGGNLHCDLSEQVPANHGGTVRYKALQDVWTRRAQQLNKLLDVFGH